MARASRRLGWLLFIAFCSTASFPAAVRAEDSAAKVYVILWFDTEDYILPASDDAALRVAEFLTGEKIRATFKVVGEKARTLEKRGRTDVITALQKHEIGYHSNFHSVQPSPAMYLANLSWDDGIAEFDRRERPGFEDVRRIFGTAPTCYGQPGSSWAPHSYAAIRNWGIKVYLDAGNHVHLEDRPHYYCGILNLYKLSHQLRTGLAGPRDVEEAEQRFLKAREKLLAQGGGIVSIYYHPCEFVHKEFWDGVNFRNGANPPRHQWKLPAAKTAAESKMAYQAFENYIQFIHRFPEVRFITATDAARLYRDKTRGRAFTAAELKAVAADVKDGIRFQSNPDYVLTPGEVLALLNAYVVERLAGRQTQAIALGDSPDGPADGRLAGEGPSTIERDQFERTAVDVQDFLDRRKRVPSEVWLGSRAITPETYLYTLAEVALELLEGKSPPDVIGLKPAHLKTTEYVAPDDPKLWGWVIFPRGFRAPALMDLAKRQAWTLKPALLDRSPN